MTDEAKIEAVARAIATAYGEAANSETWDVFKAQFMHAARAAIAAADRYDAEQREKALLRALDESRGKGDALLAGSTEDTP